MGKQLAFVAERDSAAKALQKFYKLYSYKDGMYSAVLLADNSIKCLPAKQGISENSQISFSKSVKHLFFVTAPILPVKATTLPDFERVSVDVWHYNDDYLQPQQLLQGQRDLKRSLIGVLAMQAENPILLGNEADDELELLNEGNASNALAVSSKKSRVESQWQGFTLNEAFLVNTKDGSRKLIAGNIRGNFNGSPAGKFIYWYDWKARNYFSYEIASGTIRNISSKVAVPLWDEEDDHPDDPPPHGILGWTENDASLLVYDKYDIWGLDPLGAKPAVNLTKGMGRNHKLELRYLRTDMEERFIKADQLILLKAFHTVNKNAGFYSMTYEGVAVKPLEINMSTY